MRLHRLEICGVGPFPDRQVIDFDRLNEAGIFLLAGPTGSGKTSVLDAISIALFGQAPGARQQGWDIVSHHRRPDQVPEVVLEAALGTRRIRVTRRPRHTRPKLRGDGETVVNPAVALEVADPGGEWQPVSSRIAEADRQICEWLGMDASQFSQVVMLPQGEFATFLRADARDRRRLLERLFPSHDFAFVERWLRERAKEARLERDEKHRQIDNRLSAAAAVAGEEPPPLEEADSVRTWVKRVGEELSLQATRAVELQAETKRRLERVEGLRRAAEDRAQRIERGDRDLAQAVGEWERLRIELAHGPDPEELPDDPGENGIERARKRERELRARATELQGFERDGLARRAELVADLSALRVRVETVESERSGLIEVRTQAPERLGRMESELREAEAAMATLPGAEQALAATAERLASARKRDALTPQLEAAEQAVQEERDLALATRERLLRLREARLAGIAAELARGLETGMPCPVCGAADHPRPATATADAPSKQDEEAAEVELASREAAVEEARARCEALRQEHHQHDGHASSTTAEELADRHGELAAERNRLAKSAERRGRISQDLERLREAQTTVAERLAELDGELARLAERRKACEREIVEIDRREDSLRGDDASVPARRERIVSGAELLHEAAEAAFRAGEARKARAEAEAIELEVPLAAAIEAHAAATAEHEEATSWAGTVVGRGKDFQDQAARIPALLGEYEPLVEAAAVAGELAALAQGTNPARLQLSTYVLAARLEQVIEAANLRLAPMSSGRYSLVYYSGPARHGAVSGLGIRVLDAHTGLERDASSLSGGESFYASLSLALGLAEVVQREAGGRTLDTLFIDEGFGSLDSDTLDQVMAVLDELRDGGRVIGLVSHVEELKTRIPTRIEVSPRPDGSSLALVGV